MGGCRLEFGAGGGGGGDSVAVCREMTSYYVNCVSPLKCPLCFVNILTVYRVSFETRGSLTIVVSFPLVVKMFLLLKFRERLTGQSCLSVRLDKIPARKASINRLRHLGKSVAKAFGSKAALKVGGGGDSIPKRFLRRSDQTVYKSHKFRSKTIREN